MGLGLGFYGLIYKNVGLGCVYDGSTPVVTMDRKWDALLATSNR